MLFDDSGPARIECSSKGCRTAAVYQLRWSNPRLHGAEAGKTWLACEEHRDWLSDFLSARGFLREVSRLPFTAGGADVRTP